MTDHENSEWAAIVKKLRARVKVLQALCARAAGELDEHHLDHEYLGDAVLREKIRAAGRGDEVTP